VSELENQIEALLDDDEDRRYAAASPIIRQGRPALEFALELARDPRPRLREMACYIVGQAGWNDAELKARTGQDYPRYSEAVPTLIRLLDQDSEKGVRAAAAAALGHHESLASLPSLIRAASDPSAEVRFGVAGSLGSFYESSWETEEGPRLKSEVTAALLRLTDDEDEDVRDWATFGIHQGAHDTPETRARLWKALDDPNADVRGEAVYALAKFGDRALIPRLEKLLREDEQLTTRCFEAAEEFADPALLPAVVEAARDFPPDDRYSGGVHPSITSAITALQAADDTQAAPGA
jgi:HEAT repeat protein